MCMCVYVYEVFVYVDVCVPKVFMCVDVYVISVCV